MKIKKFIKITLAARIAVLLLFVLAACSGNDAAPISPTVEATPTAEVTPEPTPEPIPEPEIEDEPEPEEELLSYFVQITGEVLFVEEGEDAIAYEIITDDGNNVFLIARENTAILYGFDADAVVAIMSFEEVTFPGDNSGTVLFISTNNTSQMFIYSIAGNTNRDFEENVNGFFEENSVEHVFSASDHNIEVGDKIDAWYPRNMLINNPSQIEASVVIVNYYEGSQIVVPGINTSMGFGTRIIENSSIKVDRFTQHNFEDMTFRSDDGLFIVDRWRIEDAIHSMILAYAEDPQDLHGQDLIDIARDTIDINEPLFVILYNETSELPDSEIFFLLPLIRSSTN